MITTLLENASSTPSTNIFWGGQGTLYVWGTWDGATVTLQASPDNGTTWIDLEDATFTQNTVTNITLHTMNQIRASISGAGGSTSLNAKILAF